MPVRSRSCWNRDLLEEAGYKVPEQVEFVDDIPGNGAGKVMKRVLRDRNWRDRDRQV